MRSRQGCSRSPPNFHEEAARRRGLPQAEDRTAWRRRLRDRTTAVGRRIWRVIFWCERGIVTAECISSCVLNETNGCLSRNLRRRRSLPLASMFRKFQASRSDREPAASLGLIDPAVGQQPDYLGRLCACLDDCLQQTMKLKLRKARVLSRWFALYYDWPGPRATSSTAMLRARTPAAASSYSYYFSLT